MVTAKVKGNPWLRANLSFAEKKDIAKDIGEQLQRIQGVDCSKEAALRQSEYLYNNLCFTSAAEKTILPAHLTCQANEFVRSIYPSYKSLDSRSLANGDMVPTHIFIDKGRLSGIIDWGDATAIHHHYELGKLMDTYDWDKALLKITLNAADWDIGEDFSKRALAMALYRQAVGLTQHSTFDVFYKLPGIMNLDNIETIDELADKLFGM